MSQLNLKPTPPPPPSAAFVELRESIESLAVAIILAMLFRSFIAEAFVIPTGSMAPTLMGRHVDVRCPECKIPYQASASVERNKNDEPTGVKVVDCRCPNCAFEQELNVASNFSNDHSFSGDRIIVSKYAYELREPERWDVIVFKFPQTAQMNFIKRLIGLPNETVRLEGGNVYVKPKGATDFAIARKPPIKLLAMLQTVHDADYPAPTLQSSGWPSRWQPFGDKDSWKSQNADREFHTTASEKESWLRYHHFEPSTQDWEAVVHGEKANVGDWAGRLISDFYAYNCARHIPWPDRGAPPMFSPGPAFGQYWVDDLAVECEARVGAGDGELLLDLVRGGWHYRARISTASGKAMLSIVSTSGKETQSFGEGEKKVERVSGQTSVRAGGTYRLRLTNVDHEMRLWVNDELIAFDGPTTYESPALVLPDIDDVEEGDLAPVGLGAKGCEVTYRHLKVLRDLYYVAIRDRGSFAEGDHFEYRRFAASTERIIDLLSRPAKSDETKQELLRMLGSRQALEFKLDADQFMPLGDNSPASSDARYWPQPYVERYLLLGRAMTIYWPHSWNSPMFFPNFRRMKPIH